MQWTFEVKGKTPEVRNHSVLGVLETYRAVSQAEQEFGSYYMNKDGNLGFSLISWVMLSKLLILSTLNAQVFISNLEPQ